MSTLPADTLAAEICGHATLRKKLTCEEMDEFHGHLQTLFLGKVLADSPAPSVPAPSARRILSERQQEVLRLLRDGLPNKEIGRRLDMAEATVKVHIKTILRIMGVQNRTQAAMKAEEYL